MKSLLVAGALLATVVSPAYGMQTGIVTATAADDVPGCADGIGKTYADREFDAAKAADEVGAFLNDHEACLGETTARSLLAQCTPAVDGVEAGTVEVYCTLIAWNPSVEPAMSLALDQFALATDEKRYAADAGASGSVHDDYNIATTPIRVAPSDSEAAIVGFVAPEAERSKDLMLIWTPPGSSEELRVLLTERDADVLNLTRLVGRAPVADSAEPAASSSSGSAGAEVLSGSSDDVSAPIRLDGGLYTVTGSYVGDSNFAVWVHFADGTRDLLFNEIGTYSGQATLSLDGPGSVIFEVTGIGSWTLEVESAF